jgi:zinc transporter
MSFRGDQLARARLNADYLGSSAWLQREVDYLNDFVVNALLADKMRPRISPVGDDVLLILPGVNLNENASPEDMVFHSTMDRPASHYFDSTAEIKSDW